MAASTVNVSAPASDADALCLPHKPKGNTMTSLFKLLSGSGMRRVGIASAFISIASPTISYAKTTYLMCESHEVDGKYPNRFYLTVNGDSSNISISGSGIGVDSGLYPAAFSPEYVQWDVDGQDVGVRGLPPSHDKHFVNRNNLEYKLIRYFLGPKLYRVGQCSIVQSSGQF